MRHVRLLRTFGYGASLALLVAFTALNAPVDVGRGSVALAQGTGQPGSAQPGEGDPGGGPAPSPTPDMSIETTSAPAQPSPGQQQATGATVLDLVPGGAVLPGTGQDTSSSIEESGDIGEGLSNQRIDPDD